MEGGKTTELSDSHFHRKMRIKGPIPAPLTLPPQPTLSSQKREDMSVPKEQNEQMMPRWAHLMPGNHGLSPLVPDAWEPWAQPIGPCHSLWWVDMFSGNPLLGIPEIP